MDIKVIASGSKGNVYYVTDGKCPLLLEAGISFKQLQKALNFKTSELAAVLVSHEHQDHAKAVRDILKAGVDCYMSEGTRAALGVSGHRVNVVQAKEQFEIGTWTVLPFDTVHDAAEPLGFLLANKGGEKLLYVTDTAYCRYRFRGLTHIMVEANHSLDILRENVASGAVPVDVKNRIIRSHFSLENVKEFLRANDLSKVQEIWLIHLSNENSDAERFKCEIQSLTGKPTFIAQGGE